MTLDQIREAIAIAASDYQDAWNEAMTDTTPGHYGVNHWEVEILPDSVFVDIPNRTFTITGAILSFDAQIGASGDEGFEQSFDFTVNGEGQFEFSEDGKTVCIKAMKVDSGFDLFGD